MNLANGTASCISASDRLVPFARLKQVQVRSFSPHFFIDWTTEDLMADTSGYIWEDVDGALAPQVANSRGIAGDEPRWESTLDCERCCQELNAAGFEVTPAVASVDVADDTPPTARPAIR
jgi:hypothetical protein